jgi:hypothetical protein
MDSNPGKPSAVTHWRELLRRCDLTPGQRRRLGQATAHADRLAALHPTRTGLAVRDELWHRTALTHYTTNPPEPIEPAPACRIATRHQLAAWLTTAAPRPYAGTMAEYLAADPGPLLLADLVDQAQLAGLFGQPDHTVIAYPITDPRDGLTGHLLTIHAPTGAVLAAGPIPPPPRRADPVEAAHAALAIIASHVDSAVALRRHTAQIGRSEGNPRQRRCYGRR